MSKEDMGSEMKKGSIWTRLPLGIKILLIILALSILALAFYGGRCLIHFNSGDKLMSVRSFVLAEKITLIVIDEIYKEGGFDIEIFPLEPPVVQRGSDGSVWMTVKAEVK